MSNKTPPPKLYNQNSNTSHSLALAEELDLPWFSEIGDVVGCKKFGPMDHDFQGVVEKVYNNSVMVSINDFDPADKSGVNELNGRAVIRQDEAKIIKAVPREDNDADDADESKDTKKKPAKRKKTTKKADKKD